MMERIDRGTFHSHLVIMNRDQLQEAYIQWDLNQMSVEDLKEFFIPHKIVN